MELRKADRLPGISKNEHGHATSGKVKFPDPNEGNYPVSQTFHIVKTGDSATNHYSIVRESENSDWQLQRAWRTDSAGRVIEEWPVSPK